MWSCVTFNKGGVKVKALIQFSTEGEGAIKAVEYMADTDQQQGFMCRLLHRLLIQKDGEIEHGKNRA